MVGNSISTYGVIKWKIKTKTWEWKDLQNLLHVRDLKKIEFISNKIKSYNHNIKLKKNAKIIFDLHLKTLFF